MVRRPRYARTGGTSPVSACPRKNVVGAPVLACVTKIGSCVGLCNSFRAKCLSLRVPQNPFHGNRHPRPPGGRFRCSDWPVGPVTTRLSPLQPPAGHPAVKWVLRNVLAEGKRRGRAREIGGKRVGKRWERSGGTPGRAEGEAERGEASGRGASGGT